MTKPLVRDPIYLRRRYDSETIELCVRWYITYRLSYRDLVAMMAERGIIVSHTTIMRWVLRYVPEFEQRWSRFARRMSLLAHGRNCGACSWRKPLPLSCRRQAWPICSFDALCRAKHRCGQGLLSSRRQYPTVPLAPQGKPRWKRSDLCRASSPT